MEAEVFVFRDTAAKGNLVALVERARGSSRVSNKRSPFFAARCHLTHANERHNGAALLATPHQRRDDWQAAVQSVWARRVVVFASMFFSAILPLMCASDGIRILPVGAGQRRRGSQR